MIKTYEDDEFERIERENAMKIGQPYLWESDAINAAIRIEREECAMIADEWDKENNLSNYGGCIALRIRTRGNT